MSDSATGVYRRLFTYLRRHRRSAIIGFIGILLYGLAGVMQIHLIGVITTVLVNQSGETSESLFFLFEQNPMLWVPLFTLFIFFVRGVGTFLNVYFLELSFRSLVNDLRIDCFNKLLFLPKPYFDEHSKGTLLTRLTFNMELIYSALSRVIIIVIREGIMVVLVLAYMVYLDWRLTLMFLVVTPIAGILVNYVSRFFKKYSQRLQKSMGDVSQIANEAITGIAEIKTFTAEDNERSRFKAASDENLKQNAKLAFTRGISTPAVQFLIATGLAVILAYAIYAKIPAEIFITFLTAALSIVKPIRSITGSNEEYQKGAVAAGEIFEQLDVKSEIDTGHYQVEKAVGEIQFNGVNFSYLNTQDSLFHNLHLTIKAGETIALVGKSGSGKSSLAALISRFYDAENPQALLLDGKPLVHYSLKNLRQQISLVAQNTTLINGSLKENIAFADLSATDDQINQAAKDAYVLEFSDKMPDGLNTQVGDNGVALSGGQRQRIAIARAMLCQTPILILDEATSALDTESERYIQQALDSISKDRTTIIIAHRLSTIEKADRILVMEQGEIIEQGTHTELIEKNGQYKKLCDMQFGH